MSQKRIFLGLFFILVMSTYLIKPISAEEVSKSLLEMGSNQLNLNAQKNEKSIDINKLLGPEDNFPFLPENHRDNSNPIARIGSIK